LVSDVSKKHIAFILTVLEFRDLEAESTRLECSKNIHMSQIFVFICVETIDLNFLKRQQANKFSAFLRNK